MGGRAERRPGPARDRKGLSETPLHAGHLRSMMAATENGAIIMPPVPAFYHRPRTIDDIVNQTVGRALDLFEIDPGIVKRWRSEHGDGGEVA